MQTNNFSEESQYAQNKQHHQRLKKLYGSKSNCKDWPKGSCCCQEAPEDMQAKFVGAAYDLHHSVQQFVFL